MNLARREFLEKGIAASAAWALAPLFAMGKHFSPQKKLKVGIIGCGSVSNMYLPHLSASEYVTIASLCDIRYDRALQQAAKFNVNAHYPDIDKMLAGESFDMLVNLTDMQEHGRLNEQALKAGKHVWSEKPLANTYREGMDLLTLARANELRLWSAPAVVNSPQFAFMSKAIQDGSLGKISAAHAHYGHLGPDWSAFFYEKGGGSLPDLGVYNLATLTGLLGPAKSIMAFTTIVTPTRNVADKGSITVEAEDNAMVVMEHSNGVLSNVQCGFNYFDPYGHHGKGQEKPTITIWGTKGNLSLIGYDWAPLGVDISTDEKEKTQRFITSPGDYVWQQGASVVAESLVLGNDPYINIEHALHVLEIIEAARESSSIGKKFNLRSTFRWPMV